MGRNPAISIFPGVPKNHTLLLCSIKKPCKTLDVCRLTGVKSDACLYESHCTAGRMPRFSSETCFAPVVVANY
jgi:hypothetical protein